jgi:Lysine methyltransferase
MPTNSQIDAPETLTGLFPADSSDEDDADASSPCYEIQSVVLAGETLKVRQFDYHSHNANRVWPGTFNLADYLLEKDSNSESREFVHEWGRILELGTATGLLAMRLALSSSSMHSDDKTSTSYCCTSIVTSDVQDEHCEIEANLRFNYELNRFERPPPHVPHTWGTGWKQSVDAVAAAAALSGDTNTLADLTAGFDTILASDILLYVSAYPALVETLKELMIIDGQHDRQKTKFVMSWNRRMKESAEFFDRMKDAGFDCTHEGKCIYTFVYCNGDDEARATGSTL